MRILVTAASRHDATTEVAHAIATALTRAGIPVDERKPEEVGHLAAYDGVVLGSAEPRRRSLAEARERPRRANVVTDACATGLALLDGPCRCSAEARRSTRDVAPILEQSGAREHRIFGGRLDKRELGFVGEKALVRMVGAAQGDIARGARSKPGPQRSR